VVLLTHPLPSSVIVNGIVVLVLIHPLLRIGGTSMFGVKFAEEVVQVWGQPISECSFEGVD